MGEIPVFSVPRSRVYAWYPVCYWNACATSEATTAVTRWFQFLLVIYTCTSKSQLLRCVCLCVLTAESPSQTLVLVLIDNGFISIVIEQNRTTSWVLFRLPCQATNEGFGLTSPVLSQRGCWPLCREGQFSINPGKDILLSTAGCTSSAA